MQNLGFHILLRLKDDYTTNSHYLTCTFLFKRLGECTFRTEEWKGLIIWRKLNSSNKALVASHMRVIMPELVAAMKFDNLWVTSLVLLPKVAVLAMPSWCWLVPVKCRRRDWSSVIPGRESTGIVQDTTHGRRKQPANLVHETPFRLISLVNLLQQLREEVKHIWMNKMSTFFSRSLANAFTPKND